ncbi:MAG: DUF4252 domain-containing protein [Bacteroidales bacterium]|nr:DUF4252 domain-containing protein [Bacteroidales bacterium]
MERILRSIIIMVILLSASTARADQYFTSMAEKEGFNYTYISPYMLKAMSGQITTFNILDTDKLEEVEIISTLYNGTDADFWRTIRGIITKFNLKTLSTVKHYNNRTDMLGNINSNKEVTHLMTITQNGGNNVTVTLMTGKIPLDSISFD